MSDDSDKSYITKNNFRAMISYTDNDESMIAGYFWAIKTLMPEFKRIAETAENFSDLKKQILDFANQHIELKDDFEDDKENGGIKYGIKHRWPL